MKNPTVCKMCGAKRARTAKVDEQWRFGDLLVTVAVTAKVCEACGEALVSSDALGRAENAVTRTLVTSGATHPDALRWLRKAAGLRAMDLAELLGVAPETVSRWEHGARGIDRADLALLTSLALDAVEGTTTTRDRLRALGSQPATGEVRAVA